EPVGDALATPMRGAATLDITAKGPLDAIEAEVRATGRELEVQGRRFGATELTATAAGLPEAPRGRVRATSALAGLGLDVGGDYALEGQALRLTNLAVASGTNRVGGAVTVALDTLLATGRLEGKLPDLKALSELAGLPLRGDASFTVALDGKGGRQAATLTAAADGLRAEGEDGPLLAARRLTVNAEVADALGTPTGKARVEMRDGAVAGTELTSLTASADGGLAKAGFQAAATGAGAKLDLAGTFARDGTLNRIRLERLQATAAGESVRLTSPAVVELGDRHYRVNGLTLASGSARLSADAALTGNQITGDVRVDRLPLELARLFDPTLRLDGVVNANATLSGTPAAPRAEVTLRADNVRAAQLTQQGVGGLDVAATARWRDARLAVDGTVTARGGAGRLALDAGLPLRLDPETMVIGVPDGGRLDGAVTGNIQLARFNDLLATTGDRMRGVLDLDVRIAGTVADPQLGGAVTLAGGRYENRASGAVISDIAARITGTGDVFTIQSFSGRTPNGGTITASGVIRPKPGEARAVDVRLRAANARLLQTDIVTATLDADLSMAGSFQRVTIAGPVRVLRAEVRVPDRMPPNVVDLEVVEVGGGRLGSTGPAPARADARNTGRSAPGAPRPGRKPGSPPPAPATAEKGAAEEAGLVLALDIGVDAQNQIFVRGRGLEAEFGGQLQVTGTAAQPIVTGRLSMLKGTLDLLARTFEFRRGVIEFDGNPTIDPRLDFLAEATANQVTAQVQVSGTAKQPKLELTSPQGLPQDEVLARVLFGKPVSQLGAAEAVQLAQSAATLAGYGGGTGILDKVRTTLGVDRLGFTQGENGKGGAVEAGRYVSDRVYVGVEQGVGGSAQSRAKVEVDITDNIQLEAGVGANADTRVGLKFEWDY
ncbi:MAG TPA: translocation/assembly module TamB domain-containing protein, partial [Azospirillum sp.]